MSIDWKKLLGSSVALMEAIDPQLALAVKAGTILASVYEDFVAAKDEIKKLAAQKKVTQAQVDALDDSIQSRTGRINAPD